MCVCVLSLNYLSSDSVAVVRQKEANKDIVQHM